MDPQFVLLVVDPVVKEAIDAAIKAAGSPTLQIISALASSVLACITAISLVMVGRTKNATIELLKERQKAAEERAQSAENLFGELPKSLKDRWKEA